jgi:antitoxin (DNA-binding transcriptional repressor) of toxin-antitoxin stability system
MKAMAVGEFKTHCSEILGEVMSGKKVGILYGRAKKPVAMLVPYREEKKTERKIGILDGKMSVKFADDFEMTTEELCNL